METYYKSTIYRLERLSSNMSSFFCFRDWNMPLYEKEMIQMYGYPGVVKVEDVVKDQENLLMKHVNEVEKIIDERKKELDNLLAELESLLEDK